MRRQERVVEVSSFDKMKRKASMRPTLINLEGDTFPLTLLSSIYSAMLVSQNRYPPDTKILSKILFRLKPWKPEGGGVLAARPDTIKPRNPTRTTLGHHHGVRLWRPPFFRRPSFLLIKSSHWRFCQAAMRVMVGNRNLWFRFVFPSVHIIYVLENRRAALMCASGIRCYYWIAIDLVVNRVDICC